MSLSLANHKGGGPAVSIPLATIIPARLRAYFKQFELSPPHLSLELFVLNGSYDFIHVNGAAGERQPGTN